MTPWLWYEDMGLPLLPSHPEGAVTCVLRTGQTGHADNAVPSIMDVAVLAEKLF